MHHTQEAFDRKRIYEKLIDQPEPEDYNSSIPWLIQQQISNTNGKHYKGTLGYLKEYPIPEIPLEKAKKDNALLLDIGCGWGRWLIGAAQKKYLPIGIDLRLEFCVAAKAALREHQLGGYTLVADLQQLPFKDNIFDTVWSYSVLQHTHKQRMTSCLKEIYRILMSNGQCKLEFPNKNGLRNRLGPVIKERDQADDMNSWCVRYYTPKEYEAMFIELFGNFNFQNHSFLGIGVLPSDLRYLQNFKDKVLVSASLLGSFFTKIVPPLKNISDSLYISCKKEGNLENNKIVANFKKLHIKNPSDNLNLLSLLKCPLSNADLTINIDRDKLIAKDQGIYYPLVNGIPILVPGEAKQL